MSIVVLDASALLALLPGETGSKKVKETLDGALLAAVNLAEVVSLYAKLGAPRAGIEAMLRPLPVRIVPIDQGLSIDAGMLRPLTIEGGFRLAIATAWRWRPALTAERRWPDIAAAARVTVELIR